jgi:hypothetical protein
MPASRCRRLPNPGESWQTRGSRSAIGEARLSRRWLSSRAGGRAIAEQQPKGLAWRDAPLWLAGAATFASLLALLLALAVDVEASGRTADATIPTAEGDAFSLALAADHRSVTLSGVIDFGATRALETMLQAAPKVRVLRLESAGGRVAEARGLATLVHRRALVTSAVRECSSACTLVLLSGERRYLEPGARLGFHRYGLRSPLVGIFLDPEAEQARDQALFRGQAVSQAFLERVATTPHETMWFPTTAELLDAGVVDAVGRP